MLLYSLVDGALKRTTKGSLSKRSPLSGYKNDPTTLIVSTLDGNLGNSLNEMII